MANMMYRKIVGDNIDNAIRCAQAASDVDHPGMVGSIREIALKHLFRPLLTDVVDTGTGKIIDSTGTKSDQIDVIIYCTDINPPILYDEGRSDMGLFPAETCLYAIEVKSQASAGELRKAIENAKSVFQMEFISGYYDIYNHPIGHIVQRIVPAFFAFGSDLKEGGKTELERYLELDSNGRTRPAIRVICVIGKGYWYFHENESAWYYWEPTSDHGEVISFLGGILNSIPDHISSRGHPRFGIYLIDKNGKKLESDADAVNPSVDSEPET